MTAMAIEKPDRILERLHALGEAEDDELPLAEAALLLAALDHPETDLAPHRDHLERMTDDARETVQALRRGMSVTDAAARALVDTIGVRHGYVGDGTTYDDPQNADLIRVIDRKRGLPVALGILYLEIAHRLEVGAQGLDTPGHFLLAVGEGENAQAIDPFNGVVLNLDELRLGPPTGASLDYGPVSRRDVLLRLLNNIHARALASRDTIRTLTITERMVLIAPMRADIWLELAKASEPVGKLNGAIRAAQSCVSLAGVETPEGREAAFILQGLKRRVN
jgi:regulator of sirC expression with transglutaminase-like and TPR domain